MKINSENGMNKMREEQARLLQTLSLQAKKKKINEDEQTNKDVQKKKIKQLCLPKTKKKKGKWFRCELQVC